MTRDYACNGPQILSVGLGGSDKFWNADIAGHAEIILASLVGSIGSVEGAGAGAYILQWRRGKLDTGSWKLPAEFVAGKNAAGVYDIRDDENIHAIITGGNCLHDRMANMNKTIEWMNKMDFILAIDIYHTPTTTYADIVLPACSRYESDEEIGMLHSGHHCLMLKEKVIDPLFESRTDFAIEKGIAEVFGVDQYLPSTAEELVRTQLSSSTDARVSSVTIEDIVASNGVYFIPWREDEIHNYPDKTFKTPTKRIELYHEDLLEYNNALPIWEPPVEATPENAQSGPYPLQLAQQHTRFLTHCAFADAEWIRQYIEPFVDLNPLDANDRGIATGDMVIVENDRGSFECKARVNECVRPGSARVYEGWWTKYFASGNIQMVANDNRNERGAKGYYGPVIPFNDTLVEVRKA